MKTPTNPRYGLLALIFALAASGIYALMVTTTLAYLETLSGLVPFDMRPTGYSFDDAEQLLAALGRGGRTYYLNRQIPLDTLYPALLSLTLICALLHFGRDISDRRVVLAGIWVALLAGLADYAENLCVALMLLGWPDVPPTLVALSSVISVSKAILTSVAIFALFGVILNRFRRGPAGLTRGAVPTTRSSGARTPATR